MGLRIGVDKLLIGKGNKGSGLNPSPSEDITDAMLFEDGSEFYMIEEDSVDYLQLVEE